MSRLDLHFSENEEKTAVEIAAQGVDQSGAWLSPWAMALIVAAVIVVASVLILIGA